MLDVEFGKPIPEAGLTPLELVRGDKPPARQIYTRVLVRYHCCGREKVVTLDNIVRRSARHSQLCRACRLELIKGTESGFAARPDPEDYGITALQWPVPPSILAAGRRLVFQPTTTRRR